MEKKREPLRYRPVAEADGKLWRDVGGLDEMKDAGCYIVQLRHGPESNQLPLEPCDDEHYIVATLIVTESGTADMLQKNRMIGQTLIMPDCDDGRTRIFNRTLRTANRNSTWNSWNNIAQTGVDNEITSTEELVASVTELVSETCNIRAALDTEKSTRETVDEGMKKSSVLVNSLRVDSSTSGVEITYSNVNGTEAQTVDIPAATAESAGVMTAVDKQNLEELVMFSPRNEIYSVVGNLYTDVQVNDDKYLLLLSKAVKGVCVHYKNGYNGDKWVIDSNGIDDNKIVLTLFNTADRKQITMSHPLIEIKNEILLLEAESNEYHVYALINPYIYYTSTKDAGGYSSEAWKRIFTERKDENQAISVTVFSDIVYGFFNSLNIDTKGVLEKLSDNIDDINSVLMEPKPSGNIIKNEDFEFSSLTLEARNSSTYYSNKPLSHSGFLNKIVVRSKTDANVSIIAARVYVEDSTYKVLKDFGSFDVGAGETIITLDSDMLLYKGDHVFVKVNSGEFYFKYAYTGCQILSNGGVDTSSSVVVSYNTYIDVAEYERYEGNLAKDIKDVKKDIESTKSMIESVTNKIYTYGQIESNLYLRMICNSILGLSIYYKNGYNGDEWVTDSNGLKNDNTLVFTFLNLNENKKYTLQAELDNVENKVVVMHASDSDYVICIAVNPYIYLTSIKEAGGFDSQSWKRIFTEQNSGQFVFSDIVYTDYEYNRLSCMHRDFLETKTALQDLRSEIDEIRVDSMHEEYVEVFSDDFSVKKSDWVFGSSWFFDTGNKLLRPTMVGDINSETIRLNRVYQCDKHILRFNVILYSDTILNIAAQRTNNNTGEGESFWQINCAENKLKMFYAGAEFNFWRGVDTSRVQAEKNIAFDIVNGREYVVEVEKNDFLFSLRFFDKISGDSTSLDNVGWNAGRLQYYYTFSFGGGTPYAISNFRIVMLNKPRVVFAGDSITEGVGMYSTDKTVSDCLHNRYAELARKRIGKSVISAVGGDVIDTIIEKFNSEYNIIRPEYLSIHIGTNGGITVNTEEKFKRIIELCDNIDCVPIINIISCSDSGNYIAINNMLLSLAASEEYKGRFRYCRFDLATAVSNYPWVDAEHPTIVEGKETRVNRSLMVDGVHPNGNGSRKMYERYCIDVPEIFNASVK